nr:unnamed protein product [Callosobruchus chinensis]
MNLGHIDPRTVQYFAIYMLLWKTAKHPGQRGVKTSLTNDPTTIVVLLKESDFRNEDCQAASDVDIDDRLSECSNASESEQKASDMGSDSDNIDLASVQHQLRQQFYEEWDQTRIDRCRTYFEYYDKRFQK